MLPYRHALFLSLLGVAFSANATTNQDMAAPIPASSKPTTFDMQMSKNRFLSAKRCGELVTSLELMQQDAQHCKDSSATGGSSCSQRMGNIQGRSAELTRQVEASSCSRDPIVLQRNFYEASRQAAEDGDIDAQMCFIEGHFRLPDENAVDDYKARSEVYASDAYARGDWRIVQLFATDPMAVSHGTVGVFINLPMAGKPFTAYRNTRLLQYGATGDYAKSLANLARSYSGSLTPQQVDSANAWAKKEFTAHFGSSSKLTERPTPCTDAQGIQPPTL